MLLLSPDLPHQSPDRYVSSYNLSLNTGNNRSVPILGDGEELDLAGRANCAVK